MRGLQRRAARGAAHGARRADRGRQALRRQRARCGRSCRRTARWRSPTAQVRCRDAERDGDRARALRRRAGRPAAVVADTAPPVAATRARRAAARARRPLRPRARRPPRRCCGWSTSRCSSGTTDEQRWDALHHPFTAPAGSTSSRSRRAALARLRHRAQRLGDRRRLDPYPPPRGPAAGVRRARASPRRRRRRASASCSTRCSTARRRTAASRSASTASWRMLAGRDSIRDVIAFPKTASGADLLTGAPAPVDAGQLAELGLRLTVPPPGPRRLRSAPHPAQPERGCADEPGVSQISPPDPHPPRRRRRLPRRLDAVPQAQERLARPSPPPRRPPANVQTGARRPERRRQDGAEGQERRGRPTAARPPRPPPPPAAATPRPRLTPTSRRRRRRPGAAGRRAAPSCPRTSPAR